MKMIIGLVGRSRTGKDTVASLFSEDFKIRKLALPVKDACKALYGWSDIEVESELKEVVDPRWSISPRQAMVYLTNSMKKLNGHNFFTKRFFENWDGEPTIITDVRYEEDINEIHLHKGITIKVERETGPRHSFENHIDDLNTTYVIQNNGTIDNLRSELDRLGLTSCPRTHGV